jgi:ABC-type nitrate/sulfonate/bicarbonate transport system substrate-binding protein
MATVVRKQGVAVVALMCFTLGAFGIFGGAQAQDKVRVFVDPSTLATAAVVGHEKGFFKAVGVDVELRVTSARNLLEALLSKEGDFILTRGSRTGTFAGQGHNIVNVALARYGHQNHVLVPIKDKTTKSLADLKGKSVAVQVGTGTYSTFVFLIHKLGMTEKDFVIRNMDGTQIPAALETGAINAGVTWEPFGTMSIDRGIARAVVTPGDYVEHLGTTAPGVLMSRWDYIQDPKARPIAQKFVAGWAKALEFVNSQQDETTEIMRVFFKKSGIEFTPEETRQNIYNFVKYDRAMINEADIADMQMDADLVYNEKKDTEAR